MGRTTQSSCHPPDSPFQYHPGVLAVELPFIPVDEFGIILSSEALLLERGFQLSSLLNDSKTCPAVGLCFEQTSSSGLIHSLCALLLLAVL